MDEPLKRHEGFTLVEIALVMVIVGLLLGGILKGQEMIMQAKTKNVIADFSGISGAYYGYQDRYRAIPGDDSGAGRWSGATVSPGAGNGVVSGKYNSSNPGDESRLWWDDLRLAGFVSGVGTAQPFNAFTGYIGVQTGDAGGGAAMGGFLGLVICSANIADKVAIAIDTQMDDGLIDKGALRGQKQTAPNPDIAGTVPATDIPYAETGTNAYTLCRAL